MDRRILASLNYKLGNVEFDQDDHPNGMPWSGILLVTDQVSDQAPSGAEGHKIRVPKEVAQAKLKTLVGMGLNYKGSRDGHAVRNKVGVITDAWMEGDAVKVKGIVWKKDFPEAVRDLKGQRLGMSMELAKVHVEDPDAPIWNLKDFVFTGATALWPKAAAYHRTALAASRDKNKPGGKSVKKKTAKRTENGNVQVLASAIGTSIAENIGETMAAAMERAMAPMLAEVRENTKLLKQVHASSQVDDDVEDEEDIEASALEDVLASGKKTKDDDDDDEDEDDDDDDEDLNAKGGKDDSDDDDDEDDEDDEDADDDDDEDEDEEDGAKKSMKSRKMNSRGKKMDARGKKFNARGKKFDARGRRMDADYMPMNTNPMRGKKGLKAQTVRAMRASADRINAQQDEIETIRAEMDDMKRTIKSQRGVIKKMEAQQDMYSEHITRRTLPPEAAALLQKAGIEAGTLFAEGRKLTVGQIDQILAEGAPGLQPKERMGIKNIFLQHGLMEEGVVTRQLVF